MKIEYITTIIHILVSFITLIASINTIINGSRNIKIIFYTFALVCILLSDTYWFTYDMLRPDIRMPFAANEIAEWAMFISLGKLFSTSKDIFHKSAVKEIICSVIFVIANVCLWMYWTGEYIQDILTGITIIYFLFNLMIFIKQNDPFSPRVWRIWSILCFLVILLNILIIFIKDDYAFIIEFLIYIILFAFNVYIFVKTLISLNSDTEQLCSISNSFTLFFWSIISMYMTSGFYYMIAMISGTISIPLMFLAIAGRKKHDIC